MDGERKTFCLSIGIGLLAQICTEVDMRVLLKMRFGAWVEDGFVLLCSVYQLHTIPTYTNLMLD